MLEKALEEGIGRKAQRKLHDLERRLATAEHNERIAQAALIKLAHETQKMKQQRKNFLQLVNICLPRVYHKLLHKLGYPIYT